MPIMFFYYDFIWKRNVLSLKVSSHFLYLDKNLMQQQWIGGCICRVFFIVGQPVNYQPERRWWDGVKGSFWSPRTILRKVRVQCRQHWAPGSDMHDNSILKDVNRNKSLTFCSIIQPLWFRSFHFIYVLW